MRKIKKLRNTFTLKKRYQIHKDAYCYEIRVIYPLIPACVSINMRYYTKDKTSWIVFLSKRQAREYIRNN